MNPKAGLEAIRNYLFGMSTDTPINLAEVDALIEKHGLKEDSFEAVYHALTKNEHYEAAAMFAKKYDLGQSRVEGAVMKAAELYIERRYPTDTFCAGEMTRLAREYGLQKASLRKIYEVLLSKGRDDCASEFADLHKF